MGICLGTTSTKDLKKLLSIINEEIEKREAQNRQYANDIFNLIDDIRSEEGCTIVFQNQYNEFRIGPDDSFYVEIISEDDEDEDEDE